MNIPGSGSKPLNIKPPELIPFENLTEKNPIGSNGQFKSFKTSPLDKIKKYLMPASYQRRETKRSQQTAISERRTQILNSLPDSKSIAHKLDSADYSLSRNTNDPSAPLYISLDLQGDDPVVGTLEKIDSQKQILNNIIAQNTDKKATIPVSEKGIQKRIQEDCALFLTNTIQQAKCPKTLCHLESSLKVAAEKGLINKKQHAVLQQEMNKQAVRHTMAFLDQLDMSIEGTNEEVREVIKQQLTELKELAVTLRTVDRGLLKATIVRKKAPQHETKIYKALVSSASRLQNHSTTLIEAAPTLNVTEERLHSSYHLLENHVRPVFQQCLIPKEKTNQLMSDLLVETRVRQRRVKKQVADVLRARKKISQLEEHIIKTERQKHDVAVKIEGLSKARSNLKEQRKKLRFIDVTQKISTQYKINELNSQIKQQQLLSDKLNDFENKCRTRKYEQEHIFGRFHFTDKKTFTPSRYLRTESQQGINSSSLSTGSFEAARVEAALVSSPDNPAVNTPSLLDTRLDQAKNSGLITEQEYHQLALQAQAVRDEHSNLSEEGIADLVDYTMEIMKARNSEHNAGWEFSEALSAFEAACNAFVTRGDINAAYDAANAVLEGYRQLSSEIEQLNAASGKENTPAPATAAPTDAVADIPALLANSLDSAKNSGLLTESEYQQLELQTQLLIDENPNLSEEHIASLVNYTMNIMTVRNDEQDAGWSFPEAFAAFEAACNSYSDSKDINAAYDAADAVLEEYLQLNSEIQQLNESPENRG